MSRRRALILTVMAACSTKRDAAREAPKPAPIAKPPPATPAPVQHLGFVPDSITVRLGHSRAVAALDMRAMKPDPLLALIPEAFACTRDLLKYMGVAVVAVDASDHFVLYATQLSEINTKDCLAQIAPFVGASTRTLRDGSLVVGVGDDAVSLRWDAGVLTVHHLGVPPPVPAPADGELLELMTHVPPQAPGFLLNEGAPGSKLGNMIVWFRIDGDAVFVSASVEGGPPGDAKRWTHDLIQGFKDGAKERHFTVDDRWFTETDDGRVATLQARIPLAGFGARAR